MNELPPDIADARERPLANADFEAVLRFLPAFEARGATFREAVERGPDEPGVIVWGEPPLSPLAVEFVETLYTHGWIVAFNWVQWDLGPRLAEHPELIARARAETLRRLQQLHERRR